MAIWSSSTSTSAYYTVVPANYIITEPTKAKETPEQWLRRMIKEICDIGKDIAKEDS